MASPQTENGYIRISTELFEHLCHIRINGESRQVFDCIIRKTYGYNKREDAISLSQFALMTGMKRPAIVKAIAKLLKMGLITRTQKDNTNGVKTYTIIKNYDLWKPEPKKITLPIKEPKKITDRTQKDNAAEPKKIHTIDILKDTKDNTTIDNNKRVVTKKITPPLEIPEALKETFQHYLDMRIKIKKPMTEHAKMLAVKQLEKLAPSNISTQTKILEQSIQNSYQGLFPLKQNDAVSKYDGLEDIEYCNKCGSGSSRLVDYCSVVSPNYIKFVESKYGANKMLCAKCVDELSSWLKNISLNQKENNTKSADKVLESITGGKKL